MKVVEPRSLGEPRGDGREAVVLCRAGALLLFSLAQAWGWLQRPQRVSSAILSRARRVALLQVHPKDGP